MASYIRLFSREYTVQYMEAAMRCYSAAYRKRIPYVVSSLFWIPEQGNQTICADPGEWSSVLRKIKRMMNSEAGCRKSVNQFHKSGKRYVAVTKKINKIDLTGLSNVEVIRLFQEYVKAQEYYVADVWVLYDANEIWAEIGRKLLAKKGLSPQSEMFKNLFSPSKTVGVLLLKSRLAVLEKRQDFDARAKRNILKEYVWVSCLDLQNSPWTMKDLDNFIENLQPEAKGVSFREAALESRLSAKETAVFKKIKELAYIKDLRDVYRRQGIYNILPLFEEIGKRLGLDRKRVAYLTGGEIERGLLSKKTPSKKEINSRMHGCAVFWRGDKIIATADKNIISSFSKKLPDFKKAVPVIRGNPAYKGVARGIAKIVLGVGDLHNVKKGDVLVAITTHPDYISAMHKASAIVTDEGGLTSHAAIVARELGIPCIVNTKIASKILKNGDRVEVDANKGTIKIIR